MSGFEEVAAAAAIAACVMGVGVIACLVAVIVSEIKSNKNWDK